MSFSKLNTGAATAATGAASFSKLGKTVAAPAAPPPAPAPVVAAAVEVEVEVVEPAAVQAAVQNSVSIFTGGGSAAAALLAITEMPNAAPVVFPVLMVSGGNAGGMFTPAGFVDEAVANQLPQGKKPVDCVFMGYRTELSAWPSGFLDRKDGDKPVWTLAVSCADAPGAVLVGEAAKSYQFTKGTNKGGWDYAQSGLGHLRPTLQLLVYLPSVDDVIVVQTPAHFTSWKSTMDNLKKLMDPKTNALSQAPVQLRIISTPKIINGNSVTEHVIDFAVMANDTGKEWYSAYAKYILTAANDAEVREKIENWVNCADRPITDDLRGLLKKAGSFKA